MVATPSGTRVEVTMLISLFAAIFLAVCFGMLANFMIDMVVGSHEFFVCLGFMLVLVVMVAWDFFPEAGKARELLTKAVFNPAIAELEQQCTSNGYR